MKISILFLLVLVFFKTSATSVTRDTTISGTWDLQGKVLHISAKIKGKGTIKNALIEANPFIQIFEPSIKLEGCRAREFSAMWYGASPQNPDNSAALLQSIHTCINSMPLFIPKGVYKFSQSLKIYVLDHNRYVGASIHIYGEGGIWNDGTVLHYTGNDFALGGQYLKGAEIDHLTLTGNFHSPSVNGSAYYSIPFSDYNDPTTGQNLAGIVIDYDGSKNKGGSTAVQLHDLNVGNFAIDYEISPNGVTSNADIILMENIRCGDARLGISSGQAQEKGNVIRGLYSWGRIHTIFATNMYGKHQAGNYTIDGGNIAGMPIRLIYNPESGWFPTHISNLYCESLGSIGTITAGDSKNKLPTSISNCVFDFAYTSIAGRQVLFTSNSPFIKFSNCLFRYYGRYSDTLHFKGIATFDNCSFSGPVTGNAGSVYIP
ncbi:MAG: hypothetical protein KGM16_11885 [Bacteroidota bacterium]|nr:hypothetical protein [Bacteroidota bacterium]